jgi:hypothetical protein
MLLSALLVAVAAVLPVPTGPFAVGRVTIEIIDRSRLEPPSPDPTYRTLVVDVWYPAEKSDGPSAPYLDAASFERALGETGLRRQLGGAYDAIKGGRVLTHAVVRAPFSRTAGRAAVLIFSPGGGLVREVYAAQLEDLASHGFVVAAITHPYDGIVTVYPDGRSLTYDPKRWPQTPSFLGEWNLNQLEWHARDIRFVLDELERVNQTADSAVPFAGHLDLQRVGAFGHSFGGVAAAKTCQTDRRFTACVNQDGLAGWRPFDADGGSWSPTQQFMVIQRGSVPGPPPDEELARMKITRDQATVLLTQLDREHHAALGLPGGAYEVVLDLMRTTHMDFTDLPLLGAGTSEDADARARVVATVRSLTLSFFDWSLRGKRPALLQRKPADSPIETIRRFGAAR